MRLHPLLTLLPLTLSSVALAPACSGRRTLVPPPEATPVVHVPVVAPPPVVICPPQPVAVVQPERPALPPEAKPGEVWCYIRVPAVTQTISENVMVTPASCREELVPPVTQEVTEQVLVKPEERRSIPVPAEFADRQEQVLVSDSTTEWRKVDCQPKNMNQGEQVGECWTLVQLPPRYATRTSRVCIRKEEVREEVIPAEYATRTRTVVVQEGFTRKIEIPPVYEVRTREVEVSPARWEWRRTSECDVPATEGAAPAPAPAPAPASTPPPLPGGAAAPAPAPGALQPGIPSGPAYDLPPAGELPPADAPAR